MEVYRVVCNDCEMSAELRIGEAAAEQRARKHAAETNHRTGVRQVDGSNEIVVTTKGRQSD